MCFASHFSFCSSRACRGPAGSRGFTLIELLVVMAIVAVLASLVIAASTGASRRAARERARAELAVLANAIEDYRGVFRSYPAATTPTALLQALALPAGPDGVAVARPGFVTLEAFVTELGGGQLAGNSIIDPWGQPYRYVPLAEAPRPGYVLYSVGEDGRDAAPAADGAFEPDAEPNLDNLYAND